MLNKREKKLNHIFTAIDINNNTNWFFKKNL